MLGTSWLAGWPASCRWFRTRVVLCGDGPAAGEAMVFNSAETVRTASLAVSYAMFGRCGFIVTDVCAVPFGGAGAALGSLVAGCGCGILQEEGEET